MEGDLFQRYFRETQKENSVIFLFFNDLHGMAKSGTFSRGVVGKVIEGCWAINVRKFSKSS